MTENQTYYVSGLSDALEIIKECVDNGLKIGNKYYVIMQSADNYTINDLSIEEQIVQEQKEMTESVENELLKIMKANAQQMARERERARINKRGNYEPIDFIDEITTNSNNVDFSATVFSIEVNTFNNKSRVNLGVNDAHGGAIYVGFAQNATLNEELIGNLKNGVNVRIRGAAYLDEFSKQLTVRAHFIDLLPPDEIAPEEATPRSVSPSLGSEVINKTAIAGLVT